MRIIGTVTFRGCLFGRVDCSVIVGSCFRGASPSASSHLKAPRPWEKTTTGHFSLLLNGASKWAGILKDPFGDKTDKQELKMRNHLTKTHASASRLSVNCSTLIRITATGSFTEEVVEDLLADGPVDLHEVGQSVEVLPARDPVRLLPFLHLLAGVVQPEEGALWGRRTGERG